MGISLSWNLGETPLPKRMLSLTRLYVLLSVPWQKAMKKSSTNHKVVPMFRITNLLPSALMISSEPWCADTSVNVSS